MKRLALGLLLIGTLCARAQPQLHFQRIVNNWPTIELYPVATCAGQKLWFGQERRNIEIRENGKLINDFEVWCFDETTRSNASIAFVFESGTWMQGTALEKAKQVCESFLSRFDSTLDAGMIVRLEKDAVQVVPVTRNPSVLHKGLDSIQGFAAPHILDGLNSVLGARAASGLEFECAVFLFTTGHDAGSQSSISDCITVANKNSARVFTVAVGDSVANADSLRKLSYLTGGEYIENPNLGWTYRIWKELTAGRTGQWDPCIITYETHGMDGTIRPVSLTLKNLCNGSVTETASYRAPRDTSTLIPLVMRLGAATVRAGDTVDVPLVMQQNLSFDSAHPFETATFHVLYDETQLDFVGLSIPNGSLFYSMPITVARIAGGVELTTTEPRTSSLLTQLPTLLSLRFKASSAPHADTLCSTISIPSWTFTAGAYTPWLSPGRVCIPGTGISNLETLYNVDNIVVYPEPNPGRFTVRLHLESQQPITMRVRNVLGQIVYETTKLEGTGEHTFTIDLGNVPSGVYVLENIISTKRSIRSISVVR